MAFPVNTVTMVLVSPVKGGFVLSDAEKRIFRKELIYPGHFVKMSPGMNEVELEFDVTDEMISHWVDETNKMLAQGIDAPIPIGHTTDVEKKRGKILRLAREFNPKRGTHSLYMYCSFVDEDAEKLAQETQVSLFSPPEWTAGNGSTFDRPIRHVALTDYPVVPGLDEFQAIAASLESEDEDNEEDDDTIITDEEDEMTLGMVAKQLGIKFKKGSTALDRANAVLGVWNRREKRLAQLQAKLAEEEDELDDEKEDDEDVATGVEEEDDDLDAREDEDEELENESDEDLEDDEDDEELGMDEDEEDEEFSFAQDDARRAKRAKRGKRSVRFSQRRPKKKPKKLNKLVLSQAKQLREMKLEKLVNDGHITPATARALRRRHCSDKAITLSLSQTSGEDFEGVLDDLSENVSLSFKEKTGAQVQRGERNALLEDAERRKEDSDRL